MQGDNSPQKQPAIKVIYQNKGKLLEAERIGYKELTSKLIKIFRLDEQSYYHLFFRDQEGDFITIQSNKDFRIFLQSPCQKKLYLEYTKDHNYHFTNPPYSPVQKQRKPSLTKIFKQKREYFDDRLQQFKEELDKQVRSELQVRLKQLRRKEKGKELHRNIFCSKCANKKSIEGVRYQCVKCNYNLCEDCEEQDDHIHPLIKILDQSQAVSSKNNMLMCEDQQIRQILQMRKQSRGQAI